MYNLEDAKKNPVYWEEKLRNDIFLAAHSYMEEQGINQTQLGKKLGVGRSRVSQILNGNYNPSMKKFIELCLALDKEPFISVGAQKQIGGVETLISSTCTVVELRSNAFSEPSTILSRA
jgi:transcriptional regulator with XRE-family HTH domain